MGRSSDMEGDGIGTPLDSKSALARGPASEPTHLRSARRGGGFPPGGWAVSRTPGTRDLRGRPSRRLPDHVHLPRRPHRADEVLGGGIGMPPLPAHRIFTDLVEDVGDSYRPLGASASAQGFRSLGRREAPSGRFVVGSDSVRPRADLSAWTVVAGNGRGTSVMPSRRSTSEAHRDVEETAYSGEIRCLVTIAVDTTRSGGSS